MRLAGGLLGARDDDDGGGGPSVTGAELEWACRDDDDDGGWPFVTGAELEWACRVDNGDAQRAADRLARLEQWRRSKGVERRSAPDAAEQREAATGKVLLVPGVRDRLERPVLLVRPPRHLVRERDQVATERLCVRTVDEAFATTEARDLIVVFDMRGFTMANWDLPFCAFFVDLMLVRYPARFSQVVVFGAPSLVRPLWRTFVKPLLGDLSRLVCFVRDHAELAEYIDDGAEVLAAEPS